MGYGSPVTLLMSVTYGVLGLAFAAAGPVTNAVGARWAYAIAAGALVAATGVASWFVHRVEPET